MAFCPAILIFFPTPMLSGRRLLSSLWSGLPQLSDDFTPWSKYLVWFLQLSSPEPLNSSRFLTTSYSTSSVFQKKLYLYLVPRLMSLPLFCILLWNFALLIIPSLNYIFYVFSSVGFFPSEYTHTWVSSTTQRNTLASGPISFS